MKTSKLPTHLIQALSDFDAYDLGACDGHVIKSWMDSLIEEVLEYRKENLQTVERNDSYVS